MVMSLLSAYPTLQVWCFKHTGKIYRDSIGMDIEFSGNKLHSTLTRDNK